MDNIKNDSQIELTNMLQDKDDSNAFAKTKEIASESELSDKYYSCIKDFATLLNSEKSYIRTRAFILICSQARWDVKGSIKGILPSMLELFHDPKPTVVRQCLNAIQEVIAFRPELCGAINAELKKIDLSAYKDSMSPLIQKDISEVQNLISEVIPCENSGELKND